MNPLWALLFKDIIRTPFSVYKMSAAELLVLCGLLLGTGYGVYKGAWALATLGDTAVEETTTD